MPPHDAANDGPSFFPFLDPTERGLLNTYVCMYDRPKTVLIVGASAGPGLTLARQHARYGHDLVLVARRRKALESLRAELEERYGATTRVRTFASNLSSPTAAEKLFQDVKGAGLDVDLVVNNADFCRYDTTTSRRAIEDPTAGLGTTLSTLMSLTALFAADMAQRDGGSVLNVGSAAAILNDPLSSEAVDDFVRKFSRDVDRDLRSKGVRARIKSHVLRSPFKLSKFFPVVRTDEKKMGNLKLRPSKYARMNPGTNHKTGRFLRAVSLSE